MAVIANPSPHPGRPVARELLLRAAAVVLAGFGILALLPLVTQLAS